MAIDGGHHSWLGPVKVTWPSRRIHQRNRPAQLRHCRCQLLRHPGDRIALGGSWAFFKSDTAQIQPCEAQTLLVDGQSRDVEEVLAHVYPGDCGAWVEADVADGDL